MRIRPPHFVSSRAVALLASCLAMLGSGVARADTADALGPNVTRERVTERVGRSPQSCTRGLERQVCVWRIETDPPARSWFARATAEPGAFHLVCDFPLRRAGAGDRSVMDSHCTVHEPLRSREHPTQSLLADPNPPSARLEKARTLVALSHAVASSPDECVQRDEAEWVCSWLARPGDPGHPMLGALATTTGTARLVCRLPLEGGDREADSCRAQAVTD